MKIVTNRGADRVIDRLRAVDGLTTMSVVSAGLSLFGVATVRQAVGRTPSLRLLLSADTALSSDLLGGPNDRSARNRLTARHLAQESSQWLSGAEVRLSQHRVPQSALVLSRPKGNLAIAMVGACGLTTPDLGLAPSDPLSLVHMAESPEELAMLASWFEDQWRAIGSRSDGRERVVVAFEQLGRRRTPAEIHLRLLDALFREMGDSFEEDHIVKSGTGIRDTVVWSKLYRFQRDGVVGVIDKLQRFGGCILADSVGLGKTFEALAVIKYRE